MEFARKKAIDELYINEVPFNEYYAKGNADLVNNRKKGNRSNTNKVFDYTKIGDAKDYLTEAGIYHWFRTEAGTGGADYIVKRNDITFPYYSIGLNDIRCIGKRQVYNIGIRNTESLVVRGVGIHNSMPSRMTVSYLIEMTSGKAAAMKGTHINGGAFNSFHIEEYRKTFEEYDMHPYGYEVMRSGTSGNLLNATISMGLVYFQALRHHVLDKIQARSHGRVKPVSRQPPKGRGSKGGLRFGEMERDAGLSHGSSAFLKERLMLVSDLYRTVFCKICGEFAINDVATKWYKPCPRCGGSTFGLVDIPYVYKLVIHLLAVPGINLRPEFVSSTEYLDSIFKEKEVVAPYAKERYFSCSGDFTKKLKPKEDAEKELMEETDAEADLEEGLEEEGFMREDDEMEGFDEAEEYEDARDAYD